MRDLNLDFEKFNEHVIKLLEKLSARGEETQDLLVNLFKGYKQCKDPEFVDYIKKKEDFYEEGGDVTYQHLMDWALNKFKARKEKVHGVKDPQKKKQALHCKHKSTNE
jgi:hypothetical protein